MIVKKIQQIFLANETILWISNEYAFGCSEITKILNKEEIIKFINFLKEGINHEIN